MNVCLIFLSLIQKFTITFFLQKIDVFGRLVDDLIAKTHEFLQPNPGMFLVEWIRMA